jgi:hypothetical protein
MKKIFCILTVIIASISIGLAQQAESSTVTNAEKTSPAVNAAAATNVNTVTTPEAAKSGVLKKSCCASGSKVSATTASTAEKAKDADKCQQVSFGMSAAKPEKAQSPQIK